MDAERGRRKEWSSSEVREIRKNQTIKKAKDSSFDKGTETLNDTYVCVCVCVGGGRWKYTKKEEKKRRSNNFDYRADFIS